MIINNIIAAVIIFHLGALFGVAAIAMISMAKNPEHKKDEYQNSEPTKLWMVGNLCKWGGEVHKIRFFHQDDKGQTLACIFQFDGARVGLAVPIEELEAVEE